MLLLHSRKWRVRDTQLDVCVSGEGSLSGRPDLGEGGLALALGIPISWHSARPLPGFCSSPWWVWGLGEEFHSFPSPRRADRVCHDHA